MEKTPMKKISWLSIFLPMVVVIFLVVLPATYLINSDRSLLGPLVATAFIITLGIGLWAFATHHFTGWPSFKVGIKNTDSGTVHSLAQRGIVGSITARGLNTINLWTKTSFKGKFTIASLEWGYLHKKEICKTIGNRAYDMIKEKDMLPEIRVSDGNLKIELKVGMENYEELRKQAENVIIEIKKHLEE